MQHCTSLLVCFNVLVYAKGLLLFFVLLSGRAFRAMQIPFGSLCPSGARKLQRALVVPTLGSMFFAGSACRFAWSVPIDFDALTRPASLCIPVKLRKALLG